MCRHAQDQQVDRVYTREPIECPWHYSGTFFWFNNKKLFSIPNWQDVPQSRWGVECYLGKHIDVEDAYCLRAGGRSGGDYYQSKTWDFIDRCLDTSLPSKDKNLAVWDSEKGVYDKQVIRKPLSRNKLPPH